MDPLDLARAEALRVLHSAAEALELQSLPRAEQFRFRPDGKGGELATPYPRIARVDPSALAAACPPSPLLEQVRPSGGWLAIDLSDAWRDTVRSYDLSLTPAEVSTPPAPDFPARILPASWRFQALLPQPQAALAARLDGGNPYTKLLRAQQLAQADFREQPSRLVLNHCALLAHLLTLGDDPKAVAQQALTLAEQFLLTRCEGAATSHFLELSRILLGI